MNFTLFQIEKKSNKNGKKSVGEALCLFKYIAVELWTCKGKRKKTGREMYEVESNSETRTFSFRRFSQILFGKMMYLNCVLVINLILSATFFVEIMIIIYFKYACDRELSC